MRACKRVSDCAQRQTSLGVVLVPRGWYAGDASRSSLSFETSAVDIRTNRVSHLKVKIMKLFFGGLKGLLLSL